MMVDYHHKKTKYATHLTMIIIYRSNNKSYYPQVLLEGCKYMVKDKAIKRYITEFSFDSDCDPNSDDEPIKLFFGGFFLTVY